MKLGRPTELLPNRSGTAWRSLASYSSSSVFFGAESTFMNGVAPLSRLVRADSLSRHVGSDVYLKLESELPTGSFKVRGAVHALTKRCAAEPIAEVVAASTGNHGAAVAYAAR